MEVKDIAEYEETDSRLARSTIAELHQRINEAREILESKKHCERLLGGVEGKTFTEQALEILDKGSDKE